VRTLKRGTRGEDVLLWQQFLVHLREQPKIGFIPPIVRVDGIFGLETTRATQAFQSLFRLPPDGIIGNDTYGKARQLGFLDPRPRQRVSDPRRADADLFHLSNRR